MVVSFQRVRARLWSGGWRSTRGDAWYLMPGGWLCIRHSHTETTSVRIHGAPEECP